MIKKIKNKNIVRNYLGFIQHQKSGAGFIQAPSVKKKSGAGFTLIELLVVIAIIGLLASVVLVNLNSARGKARDAKRRADIRQMQTALELYFDKYGSYPSSTSWANDCGGDTSFATALNPLVTEGFISKVPKEPKNPSAWPVCYYYQTNYNCNIGDAVHPYILIFQAENPLTGYTSWSNEVNRYCVFP